MEVREFARVSQALASVFQRITPGIPILQPIGVTLIWDMLVQSREWMCQKHKICFTSVNVWPLEHCWMRQGSLLNHGFRC